METRETEVLAGGEPDGGMERARVLRVRWCSSCGTWYGAHYLPDDAAAEDRKQHTCQHCYSPCAFFDRWPKLPFGVPAVGLAGCVLTQLELGL